MAWRTIIKKLNPRHILPTITILCFKQDVLSKNWKLTVYFPPYQIWCATRKSLSGHFIYTQLSYLTTHYTCTLCRRHCCTLQSLEKPVGSTSHPTFSTCNRKMVCQLAISVNPNKWTLVQFTYLRNTYRVHINFNDVRVPTVSSVKYLRVILDSKLTRYLYIRNTIHKTWQRFYELRYLLGLQSKTPT